VLGVTALGASLDAAVEGAYRGVGRVSFDGMHYRKDIGRRAIARLHGAR
jgi:phosphoribosylamine--glycine ligase